MACNTQEALCYSQSYNLEFEFSSSVVNRLLPLAKLNHFSLVKWGWCKHCCKCELEVVFSVPSTLHSAWNIVCNKHLLNLQIFSTYLAPITLISTKIQRWIIKLRYVISATIEMWTRCNDSKKNRSDCWVWLEGDCWMSKKSTLESGVGSQIIEK